MPSYFCNMSKLFLRIVGAILIMTIVGILTVKKTYAIYSIRSLGAVGFSPSANGRHVGGRRRDRSAK